jgi:hypothetical protein
MFRIVDERGRDRWGAAAAIICRALGPGGSATARCESFVGSRRFSHRQGYHARRGMARRCSTSCTARCASSIAASV